jgi:hypothetical protein
MVKLMRTIDKEKQNKDGGKTDVKMYLLEIYQI